MVALIDTGTLAGLRDHTLLLIGFAAALAAPCARFAGSSSYRGSTTARGEVPAGPALGVRGEPRRPGSSSTRYARVTPAA